MFSEAFARESSLMSPETRLSEFQSTLSQRVGEILKPLRTEFVDLEEPQAVLGGMEIAPADRPIWVSPTIYQCDRPVGRNLGSRLPLPRSRWARRVPGVGGSLRPFCTPPGPWILIGLIVGAVLAVGAWWLGKEKVRGRG